MYIPSDCSTTSCSLDTPEELERQRPGSLLGNAVLTNGSHESFEYVIGLVEFTNPFCCALHTTQ